MNPEKKGAALCRSSILKSIHEVGRELKKHRFVYFLSLLVAGYFFIFNYIPMYGVTIAFKNFSVKKGILGSDWVGLKYFREFFKSYYFTRTVTNTFLMSLYGLLWGFPAPILLALLLNEVKTNWFKRTIQTATYLPYFVSTVVIAGIIRIFLATNGVVNQFIQAFGGNASNLLAIPEYFRTIIISTNIWTSVGFGSILYLAALTAIDPGLYDAASIDGAGRMRKIWHISIPGIMNVVIIMLIFACGSLLSVNGEKILLLYNESTYKTADVIATFTYRKGLVENNFSYSTAVGLFNSLVNFILLVVTNYIAGRSSEYSLW